MMWPGPGHLAPPGSFHQLLSGWPAPGPVTAAGLGSEWCWLGSGRLPRGLLLPPGHRVDRFRVSGLSQWQGWGRTVCMGCELSDLRLLDCWLPAWSPSLCLFCWSDQRWPSEPRRMAGPPETAGLGQADSS